MHRLIPIVFALAGFTGSATAAPVFFMDSTMGTTQGQTGPTGDWELGAVIEAGVGTGTCIKSTVHLAGIRGRICEVETSSTARSSMRCSAFTTTPQPGTSQPRTVRSITSTIRSMSNVVRAHPGDVARSMRQFDRAPMSLSPARRGHWRANPGRTCQSVTLSRGTSFWSGPVS